MMIRVFTKDTLSPGSAYLLSFLRMRKVITHLSHKVVRRLVATYLASYLKELHQITLKTG